MHSQHLRERCPLNREPIKLSLLFLILFFPVGVYVCVYVCVCVHKLCHFHDYNSFSLHFSVFVPATHYFSILLPSISHSYHNHSLSFILYHILILSLSLFLLLFLALEVFALLFLLCTDCELRINDKLRPNLRYDSVFLSYTGCFFSKEKAKPEGSCFSRLIYI